MPIGLQNNNTKRFFCVLRQIKEVDSGPMTGKRRQKVCQFTFTNYEKVAENIQNMLNIVSLDSNFNIVSHSKKNCRKKHVKEHHLFQERAVASVKGVV